MMTNHIEAERSGAGRISFHGKQIPHAHKQIINHSYDAFYFLIAGAGRKTFPEFAELIESVYDKTNPQTAEVCRVLRLYPPRKV